MIKVKYHTSGYNINYNKTHLGVCYTEDLTFQAWSSYRFPLVWLQRNYWTAKVRFANSCNLLDRRVFRHKTYFWTNKVLPEKEDCCKNLQGVQQIVYWNSNQEIVEVASSIWKRGKNQRVGYHWDQAIAAEIDVQRKEWCLFKKLFINRLYAIT